MGGPFHLDFGCGRGTDVELLRARRIDASATIPIQASATMLRLTAKFDLILCIYVLNVLPTEMERQAVIRQAAGFPFI